MTRKVRLNGSNEIGRSVEKSLDEYFRKLDGEPAHNVYEMVIGHVERALLASIMERAGAGDRMEFDVLTGEMLGSDARAMLFTALENFVRARAPGRVGGL